MKKLILTLLIALPCFLSAQTAKIKIDIDRKIGVVDPNIYGGFLEAMVAYRGLYEPDSPLSNKDGFRQDFIDLIKELNVPVVRWPGGNYVSGYNWEDGIGPKDQRPTMLDLAWHFIETNQLGTDEYVKLCKLIGAENFVCINAGTGTLDDARHWVEYCNYEKGTKYADLRRKNGNEEPFKIKYWALGNEIDGPWQMGQKSAEDYCKFALEAAKLIQLVDKDVKLVASGASLYDQTNKWVEWNDYVLNHMVGKIDYLSVHRYATEALPGGRRNRNFADIMCLGLDIDQKIDVVKAQIKNAMYKSGSKRPVFISFDEWSSAGPGLTGALMVAQHLNSFIRHADIVKMANLTMLTSLVGNSPEGDFKNEIFQSFYLYSNNCLGTALDVYTDCEKYSNEVFSDIPYLDVTAVLNESELVISVVNRNETNAIQTDVFLQAGNYTGNAKVIEINAMTTDARNTKTEENVSIKTREIKFKDNTIQYSFPAHSFTQILVDVKK
jgi:alpha-L-arabinofuranosidase